MRSLNAKPGDPQKYSSGRIGFPNRDTNEQINKHFASHKSYSNPRKSNLQMQGKKHGPMDTAVDGAMGNLVPSSETDPQCDLERVTVVIIEPTNLP